MPTRSTSFSVPDAPATFTPADLERVEALAQEFDRQRHCGWNCDNVRSDYDAPDFEASDVPPYASLGAQCTATLQELALLHTLRRCKDCGSEFLYKSAYQIACCSCFGEDECREREEEKAEGMEGCHNCATNMNLPDAITRWNLHHGDQGERGRVQVIG